MRIAFTGTIFHMTAAELERLAEDLGLDVVGAAPASAYEDTERHIHERKARGLFADMRFTMAQPEVSCHPETLLPGARTVVSAAYCYYAPEPPLQPGEGRLPRYTWSDGYAVLRERLDALGRRLGGAYRVLVDANQHVDREGAARAGVGFYGKNTMLITRRHGSWVVLGTLVTEVEIEPNPPLEGAEPSVSLVEWLSTDGDELVRRYERLYVPRNDPRYLRRNALVALGNTGGPEHRALLADYAEGDDELLRDHAAWALRRLEERLET